MAARAAMPRVPAGHTPEAGVDPHPRMPASTHYFFKKALHHAATIIAWLYAYAVAALAANAVAAAVARTPTCSAAVRALGSASSLRMAHARGSLMFPAASWQVCCNYS